MKSWIKINKKFHPEQNFWELNPQLAYIEPFSELYDTDEGGLESSNYMWAVFFMQDNDEEENLLYRYPTKERIKAIKKFFPDIDLTNELYRKALKAYPSKCLSSVQRALLLEQKAIEKRTQEIDKIDYYVDYYMKDDQGNYKLDNSGKPILIKGTSKQLDDVYKNSELIYTRLEKALAKFQREKEEEARVRGGRKKTFSEKGLV